MYTYESKKEGVFVQSVSKLILIVLFIPLTVFGQDLLESRIRKLTPTKKAVFIKNGIFHNGNNKLKSKLKTVRHSYSSNQGYERVVFDFTTKKIPKLYGNISSPNKRLYFDMFNTDLIKGVSSVGTSKFVKNINFLPLTKDSLSVEVIFKKNVEIDLFYLEAPGRFVIDVKEM